MKNKLILIALLFVALIFFVAFYYRTQQTFEYRIKKMGIEIKDASSFRVKEATPLKIFAENNGQFIKIETKQNVSHAQFEEYVGNQSALLMSIFEDHLPPYPEFLTKQTGCDKRFLPKKEETNNGIFFILPAGDRFGYGVCADDLVKYHASLGLYFCEETSTLFKVEYFIDQKENINVLSHFNNEFKCS